MEGFSETKRFGEDLPLTAADMAALTPPVTSDGGPGLVRAELAAPDYYIPAVEHPDADEHQNKPEDEPAGSPGVPPAAGDIASPDQPAKEVDEGLAASSAGGGLVPPPEPPDAARNAGDMPDEEPERPHVPVHTIGMARFASTGDQPPDPAVTDEYVTTIESTLTAWRDDEGVDYTDDFGVARSMQLTSDIWSDNKMVGIVMIEIDTNDRTSLTFVNWKGDEVEQAALLPDDRGSVAQVSPDIVGGEDAFDALLIDTPTRGRSSDRVDMSSMPQLTEAGLGYLQELLRDARPAPYDLIAIRSLLDPKIIVAHALGTPTLTPEETRESLDAARLLQRVVRGTLEAQGYDRTTHRGAMLELASSQPPAGSPGPNESITVQLTENEDQYTVAIRSRESVRPDVFLRLGLDESASVYTSREIHYIPSALGLSVVMSSTVVHETSAGSKVLATASVLVYGGIQDAGALRNFLRWPEIRSRALRDSGTDVMKKFSTW